MADGLLRYPLVLIAMHNVWDWIARYIPLVPRLKLESIKDLMIAILSRFLQQCMVTKDG
jgi:equilibrative nucleoside transporter 1/2/3